MWTPTVKEAYITVLDPGGDTPDMPRPNVFMDLLPVDGIVWFSSATPGAVIYTGISSVPGATEPEAWSQTADITLTSMGTVTLFAKAVLSGAPESDIFAETVEVTDLFPPVAGDPLSDAVHRESSLISGWASACVDYEVGADCDPSWQTPGEALGQAEGNSFDIVCLGNGGWITLTFDAPVQNGYGPDLAVFENGFSDTFLELAYVEVSSNGTDFIRFDSVSLTTGPVGAFGSVNPEDIYGLAGRYRQGYGTPFDLDWLRFREEVLDGTVDLDAITHIRIVDIFGNPDSGVTDTDSFGNTIYDPYRTMGSGGFDLDGIAMLNSEND